MKILITGSSGFIATALIPKLVNLGHLVVGVDSLISESSNYLTTSTICDHSFFDIRDTSALVDYLSGVDLVFHLAARGNVVESIKEPIVNFESNVRSTLNLLECMREAAVPKIIFSSTGGALMGDTAPPVNESSLPKPISPYGASKLACEGYLSAYCNSYGINAISLRFGNVYGPYSSHKSGVINTWIRACFSNNQISIFGDGSSSRDYIHVDDLTDGLLLALDRININNKGDFEIYHLANNSEISLDSLKDILVAAVPAKYSPKIKYMEARVGEVKRNFADTKLARQILGFHPSTKFSQGVNDLVNWIKIHEFKDLD